MSYFGTVKISQTSTDNDVDIAAALPAGTNAIGKLAANSGVDIGDIDVTSIIPGTGATNLGKAEDAVHGSGDTGIQMLAVRQDTPTNLVSTAGDYAPLQVDDLGGLRISAPNNRAVSGTLNALNATVTIVGDGLGSIEWEVDTGNLVGTVSFEASLDDSTWFAINGVRIDGTIISSTNAFADRGTLSPTGYSRYRLRVSAFTSGSSSARMEGALSADTVRLGQALPVGGNFVGYVGISGAVGLASAAQSDTYAATGNGVTIDVSGSPVKFYSIQVKGTGAAATTWDVKLEGSNDNANFQQIIQHTQVTGDGVLAFAADAIARPCRYFRSRCAALALGAASDIVVTITGIQ